MERVLPSLLFLACPISMGAMMWYMMRAQQNEETPPRVEAAS